VNDQATEATNLVMKNVTQAAIQLFAVETVATLCWKNKYSFACHKGYEDMAWKFV
jgi:hypothetical protein